MPSRTLSPFKTQLPGQVWLQVALPPGGQKLFFTALPMADKEKRVSTYTDPPNQKESEPTDRSQFSRGE